MSVSLEELNKKQVALGLFHTLHHVFLQLYAANSPIAVRFIRSYIERELAKRFGSVKDAENTLGISINDIRKQSKKEAPTIPLDHVEAAVERAKYLETLANIPEEYHVGAQGNPSDIFKECLSMIDKLY